MHRPATIIPFPTSVEAPHVVAQAKQISSDIVSGPRGIRGRWQTVRECLPTSPNALRRQLYGPQTRSDDVVFAITAATGIVVTLGVFAALWMVGPA